MSKVIIRPARLGDEQALAKVHIQSWQEAYKGIVPQDLELPRFPGQQNMWYKPTGIRGNYGEAELFNRV